MSSAEKDIKKVKLGPKKIKIPQEWGFAPIAEVGTLQSGNGFKSKDFLDEGTLLVKISNIQNEKVSLIEKQDYLPPSFQNHYDNYLLETDDLLIALSGATTGKMGFVNQDILPAFLNQRVARLRVGSTNMDKKYLGFYLMQKMVKEFIFVNSQASAQQNISPSFIENIRTCVPPLPEQKKIAEILSTVDSAIQKTDEIIERTKELKKGLIQDLLTKGIGHDEFKEIELGPKKISIPSIWIITKMDDIASVKYGRSLPDCKGEVPAVGSSGVFDRVGMSLIAGPTIVVGRKGSAGQAYLIESPSWPSDTTFYLEKIRDDRVDLRFLNYQMELRSLAKELEQTTLPSLSRTRLENYRILLPPLPEQKKIANILSTVDEKIQQEKAYKEELENLKKGLMQDLLTGKVRVLPLLSNDEKEQIEKENVTG